MNKTFPNIFTCFTFLFSNVVQAEVIFDGTLGSRVALDGPDYAISAELGQQQGNNLFHSFESFNINTGESATFSGPDNITNVISRVTGGQLSYIDGTLRNTIPQANTYLINPAGLLFGSNASLDVQGSFHASTADTLRFQDEHEFNAQHPEQSTLTIAPPAAFGFLDDSPAQLRLEGTQLSVSPEKTLSLIGGEIQLEQARIDIEDGRLNIASVAGPGNVVLTEEDLVVPSSMAQLTLNNAQLYAEGEGGGTIYLRAGQLDINSSVLSVSTFGIGNSHGIDITAHNVTISDGSALASENFGTGQGGDIQIKATGIVTVVSNSENNSSGIYTSTESQENNAGDAGNISIDSNEFHLHSGGSIVSATTSTGQGGRIAIQATETILLDAEGGQSESPGYIYSLTKYLGKGGVVNLQADKIHIKNGLVITDAFDEGQGGNIDIETAQLNIIDSAQVMARTQGDGHSGDVTIRATDNITVSGEVIEEVPSAIFSETGGKTLSETGEEFLINWGSGNAGNITLKTNQLILQEGGQISTTTYSKGQGGDILIEANNISISGIGQLSGRSSGLFSESDVHSEGSAGEIALTANRLDLEKNARVSTRTFGIGEGGIIKIHVTGAVNLAKNATIASGTRGEMENAGDGGFIILEADTLTLNEDSTISAKSTGAGLAGNINLTINTMLKTQDSAITTETNQADGGNIKILSDGYVYLVNGKITTSVKAQTGNGGNVTLSPEFVVLKGGKIIAQAVSGAGGNIDINTTSIYRFPPSVESIIDASSKLGIDGEVSINSPEIDIEGALYALPDTFTDVSTFLRQCGMIDENLRSSFLVIPYAGQLNSPEDWKPSGLLIQVSQANDSTKRNGTSIHSKYQTLLW